jgi:hypothetical protein
MKNMLKKIAVFIFLALTLAIWQVFFVKKSDEVSQEAKLSESVTTITAQSKAEKHIITSGDSDRNSVDGEREAYDDPHKDDVRGKKYQSIDYGTYDIPTLESLANSGDVKAMKVLALRYLELALNNEISSEQLVEYSEKKNQYTSKAIIYGDREMLSLMPELKKEISHLESTSLTPEEKHSTILNVLAHYEFMGLRGSMRDKYDGQRLFFKTYSDSLGLPSSLSESDKNTVRAKAKEIYDAQEKKRIELGLGPFDNSNSESVLKAYEMQRQLYLSEMGSLVIE